jgi:hypothetical protein
LYGRDMKKRRRGRILMVSSICGSVAGIPTVALYAATKAFQNSLAIGIAKEMETSGVGVTCIMPGAVRDTDFRTRSKTNQALCWKLPFYAKTPPEIAKVGVRSMLRGDTEVTPGWQNRLFVKVLKPVLPQRLHNLVAEILWNPLPNLFRRNNQPIEKKEEEEVKLPIKPVFGYDSRWLPHQLNDQRTPRLLKLEEQDPDIEDEYTLDGETAVTPLDEAAPTEVSESERWPRSGHQEQDPQIEAMYTLDGETAVTPLDEASPMEDRERGARREPDKYYSSSINGTSLSSDPALKAST